METPTLHIVAVSILALIFLRHGTSESNPDLYSCVEDGEVVYTYTESQGTTPSLGNQVQIKDNRTGRYFRYCHMLYGSIVVQVGDHVTNQTKLRKNGKYWKFNWNSLTFRVFYI